MQTATLMHTKSQQAKPENRKKLAELAGDGSRADPVFQQGREVAAMTFAVKDQQVREAEALAGWKAREEQAITNFMKAGPDLTRRRSA